MDFDASNSWLRSMSLTVPRPSQRGHMPPVWLNDALTVAVAWVTATAVAIVLRLQGAWGDARSRARERQVARAMARHSAAEIRATRPIPSNDEGRLNADPEIGQTTLREAALNAWGVKQAATFELIVAAVAVFELVLFIVAGRARRHRSSTHHGGHPNVDPAP